MDNQTNLEIEHLIETKLKELGYENLLDIRPETLSFLKDLRSQEIEELKDALEFSRKTKTVSSFLRWLIVSTVVIFITMTSIWDSVIRWKVALFSIFGK